MSDNDPSYGRWQNQVQASLSRLQQPPSDARVDEVVALVNQLKAAREFELMGELLEALSRWQPRNPTVRRLYAQQLIETGHLSLAVDVLNAARQGLDKQHAEYAETGGLLGRVYKQMFLDASNPADAMVQQWLKQSIDAYREIYDLAPERHSWHGTNVLALLSRARKLGLAIAPELDVPQLARQLLGQLQKSPTSERDEWYLATLAEVSLAADDWDAMEAALTDYIHTESVTAFQLNSLLRQLIEVWDLEHQGLRGQGLVAILRARVARMSGGDLDVLPHEIRQIQRQSDPEPAQLEALLGSEGPKTYRWWKTGVDRARSVAAIYEQLGDRVGTGFLVKAGDVGLEPKNECLLLTNFHVCNPDGAYPGLRPQDIEVAFETESADQRYGVQSVVWSSAVEHHDACLLRLESLPEGVGALPVSRYLPAIEDDAKVYIIGHPRGRELSFSFQDNQLLDHEGPPAGSPAIEGVCKVHYRAPTEPGSSGSPVFNANQWKVIALHHAGGKIGMRRLNQKEGTYAANEGISLESIAAAIQRSTTV